MATKSTAPSTDSFRRAGKRQSRRNFRHVQRRAIATQFYEALDSIREGVFPTHPAPLTRDAEGFADATSLHEVHISSLRRLA